MTLDILKGLKGDLAQKYNLYSIAENISQNERIDLLINTIKKELVYVYDLFIVKRYTWHTKVRLDPKTHKNIKVILQRLFIGACGNSD
jgi:hypothetical protein